MNFRKCLAVGAALVVIAVAPGAVAADNATAAASSVERVGASPEIEKWADAVGEDFLDNSTQLGKLNTYIQAEESAHDRGYVISVNDPETRSTTMYWTGDADVRLQDEFLAEAESLGVKANLVGDFPVSYAQVEKAQNAIWEQEDAFAKSGFVLDGVAALSLDSLDSIIVRGHYVDGAAEAKATQLESVDATASALVAVNGVAIEVQVNETAAEPYLSRTTDTAPFYAGGLFVSNLTGEVCSSGFAVRVSGVTHTTTARHCNDNAFRSYDSGAGVYGNVYAANPYGGVLMEGTGSGRVFDGSPLASSNAHAPVGGFADLNPGDFVCTQGGNSGTHCGIRVQSINLAWSDGISVMGTLWGIQTNGNMAAAAGDSGGPVITLNGSYWNAAGMIQGTNGNRYLSAQTCYQNTKAQTTSCSYDVVFTSMRSVADLWGASLVTG